MTLGDINTKVTELTKADTVVAYPNANRLINLNIWNQNVVTKILQSQDSSDFADANRAGYSILDADLTANVRDYNFGISEGVVEVKRVEVSYDGAKAVLANAFDSSQFEDALLDETTSSPDNIFSRQYPSYEWKGNSVFIYPKPTETVGKIFVEVSQTAKDFVLADLTTGTAKPGFDENFHVMVAYGMAREYFAANGKWDSAGDMDKSIAMLEMALRKQYGKKNVEVALNMQSYYENYN